jgi:hypothetical protein
LETIDADLRLAAVVFLVGLVVGRGQVAGVGVERLEQTAKCAVGHLGNIRDLDVVRLNVLQDLAVDVDLVVGVLRRGVAAAATLCVLTPTKMQRMRATETASREILRLLGIVRGRAPESVLDYASERAAVAL